MGAIRKQREKRILNQGKANPIRIVRIAKNGDGDWAIWFLNLGAKDDAARNRIHGPSSPLVPPVAIISRRGTEVIHLRIQNHDGTVYEAMVDTSTANQLNRAARENQAKIQTWEEPATQVVNRHASFFTAPAVAIAPARLLPGGRKSPRVDLG